jgi:hypothetical protein
MDTTSINLNAAPPSAKHAGGNVGRLLEVGRTDAAAVLQQLVSRVDGLSREEADARLKQYG